MYIERRRDVHTEEKERKISASKMTFIDSIIDVQSERVGMHTYGG